MKVLLFFVCCLCVANAVNYYQRKSNMDRFLAVLEKQKEVECLRSLAENLNSNDVDHKYLDENPFFTLYTNVTYLLRQILHI